MAVHGKRLPNALACIQNQANANLSYEKSIIGSKMSGYKLNIGRILFSYTVLNDALRPRIRIVNILICPFNF